MNRFVRAWNAARNFGLVALVLIATPALADPLPSWNDTGPKKAILDFVARVTTLGSPDYVDPQGRIATFDNDGTLWLEQPVYTQIVFSVDQTRSLAAAHPEWTTTFPYSAALAGDYDALLKSGGPGLQAIMSGPFAGMSDAEFMSLATVWLSTVRHPRFRRPYTELIYQPMLELLTYLRAEGFRTFIVSGAGMEFMRTFSDPLYGIPPWQVVGSSSVKEFRIGANGLPEIIRNEAVAFVDDGVGKAVGINWFIGVRPIFAFGNSDGDLEMLQWTAAGDGARFMGLVHHTDAVREYAYDHPSLVGQLDKAWAEAKTRGWTVVSMKDDWAKIFPWE